MIELDELVTFMGKSGRLRSTILYEKEYIQPYRVEYYSNNEHLGSMYFLTKERAEEAAQIFAFGDNKNGNSNV
jgi:hypothetical protein